MVKLICVNAYRDIHITILIIVAWLVNEIKSAPVISADAEKRQQHAIKDSATKEEDDDMPRTVDNGDRYKRIQPLYAAWLANEIKQCKVIPADPMKRAVDPQPVPTLLPATQGIMSVGARKQLCLIEQHAIL